jgi:hypothetical protein
MPFRRLVAVPFVRKKKSALPEPTTARPLAPVWNTIDVPLLTEAFLNT